MTPGGRIYPNNDNDEYGTLGAFANANSPTRKKTFIAGLTCRHVLMRSRSNKSFIDSSGTRIHLGDNIEPSSSQTEARDSLAAVEIDRKTVQQHCSLDIIKDQRSLHLNLYEGNDDSLENQLVFKKGGSTGWTDGTIIASEMGPGRILIEGLEKAFCEPGDSGSIVYRYKKSAEDDTLEAISMVQGVYEEKKKQIGAMSFRLKKAMQDFKEDTSITLTLTTNADDGQ